MERGTTSHRLAEPSSEHRAVIWMPWVAGPEETTDEAVVVSLTEFEAHRKRDMPSIALTALRLRAGWYGLPGAVGLHLWADPVAGSVGSLSVWTNASDLKRWIALPFHARVMRRYRPRSTARSTQWSCARFDREAIVADAKRRLTRDR